MIELDWKQKILIGLLRYFSSPEQIIFINNCLSLKKGMSSRQVSHEYREQQQRTLLGFGIYYIDDNCKLKCLNIDLVSSNLSQTATDSVNGFRYSFSYETSFNNLKKYKNN